MIPVPTTEGNSVQELVYIASKGYDDNIAGVTCTDDFSSNSGGGCRESEANNEGTINQTNGGCDAFFSIWLRNLSAAFDMDFVAIIRSALINGF